MKVFVKKTLIYLSFLSIGGAIGWLAGLSSSPVIGMILSSLLSIITTVIFVFFNLKKKSKEEYAMNPESILYLGVFFFSLVVFGTVSLKVRNNLYFIGMNIEKKTNEIFDILKVKPDYDLYYYEISRFENDSIDRIKYEISKLNSKTPENRIKLDSLRNIVKIDSLRNIIIRDSLQNNNYNKLLKFSISKSLIEDKYGISLDLDKYFKILSKDTINIITNNIFYENIIDKKPASNLNIDKKSTSILNNNPSINEVRSKASGFMDGKDNNKNR